MPPKSLSFKSIYSNILPNSEQSQELSTPTHLPSPLVYSSPLMSNASPAVSKRKKLSIDRPLRISHDFKVASFDSELKEYSAVDAEYQTESNEQDMYDKMPSDSKEDANVSVMNFNAKMKHNQNSELTEKEGNRPVLCNSGDSLNTTTVEGTDIESFRDIELNSARTSHPLNQGSDSMVGETGSEGKKDKGVEAKMRIERKNSIDPYKNFHKITEYSRKKETQPEVSSEEKNTTEAPETMAEEAIKVKLFEENNGEADCIKILVCTDTHLGFKEEDTYRANDSMNTFEELLYLAKNLEVDLILHAGDLFDKNVPSRSTMYRTMDLLSNYLSNHKSELIIDKSNVINTASLKEYEMQSTDQEYHLRSSYSTNNEQMRPFFVIHGNHDNPTYKNCLSPIDILDVAGLVTYFGRYLDLTNVVVKPILITKSNVKIALYGLGWIKDERLVELFDEKEVKFEKCEEDRYKILLLHQNRYPRRGSGVKDYITTDMIPDWFDLVIWGHEHESIKFPEKTSLHKFQILQPGSTIQTTLVPAELPPKHGCLIHVSQEDVNFYPISLLTSRKFICDEIENYDSEENLAENSSEMYDYLRDAVQKILDTREDNFITHLNSVSLTKQLGLTEWSRIESIVESSSSPLLRYVEKKTLTRRIKIDGKLYENINPKIFGRKVANPNDMLKISNKKRKTKDVPEYEWTAMSIRQVRGKKVMTSVEDTCRLSLLLESDLNDAVCRFVNGNESRAIMEYVRGRVSEMEDYLKEEIKNKVLEPLSEDIYSELIVNTIQVSKCVETKET
ncbi:uncharacterized protein TOT_040000311 [Theileria orientalis strain Shintoku]|uniref:Mre11 DNA-binding domain-containing protein n=1 Tax=Theileria orientalis strain Shintoku TaxID=869250 RepID=J4C4C2_THEOR|nr:uncharacterized protein TOT_040000311 [Theileria orientalis strain Shintoku]BAM41931.1 uncharacterized protein TOT_040000311 [Theileria orientalis strain Shintoku]|eukprot:XP_009692232.1 uncharacterized protein TOT_040000311 [Theileria orientalis strain Shintoku]